MKIAFQGAFGANSHQAVNERFPHGDAVPCHDFKTAFQSVENGETDAALIPIDNTSAGRVADIHYLLPRSKLFIRGEHFLNINHAIMGLPGATLDRATQAHSHVHALGQSHKAMARHSLQPVVASDTAAAAQWVAAQADPCMVAIANPLAAEIYGLEILDPNANDNPINVTRFVELSLDHRLPPIDQDQPIVTTLMFRTRSVSAALYKALGGFATNGINMTKLESYIGDDFGVAEFLLEVEAHPEEHRMKDALDELDYFSAPDAKPRILGVYPAASFRTAS